eukprot:GILJ01013818.1.p1 GENE.GILJ01013818.1~~GILJ01013818.1.p1  ORF type:complete len:379 (-),score=20.90 GILJ01013818.1:88-1191(-)
MGHRLIGNVLVTGGAGFMGSAFIRFLFKQEEFLGIVVNFDLLTYAGNLANVASVHDDPRYKFVQGDICDGKLVEETCVLYNINTIVHFAAESHVDRSIHSPRSFVETNVLGTFQLLEVLRRHPQMHFHHISTDEVYGALDNDGVFTESSAYKPNSPYSASKAASDHFVRAYHKTYGLSVTMSNSSNNYGPFQYFEKLIPHMIMNCFYRKLLPVYGNGLNVRDWVHVDDHAAAVYAILKNGETGETYNIGGDAERTNIDVVKTIVRLVAKVTQQPENDLAALITYVSDRPGHDFRYAVDCTKLKSELGWSPSCSFEEGLEATIEWYLELLQTNFVGSQPSVRSFWKPLSTSPASLCDPHAQTDRTSSS